MLFNVRKLGAKIFTEGGLKTLLEARHPIKVTLAVQTSMTRSVRLLILLFSQTLRNASNQEKNLQKKQFKAMFCVVSLYC